MQLYSTLPGATDIKPVKTLWVANTSGVFVPVRGLYAADSAGVIKQTYADEVVVTITTNRMHLVLSSLFSPDEWANIYLKKRVRIAAGVFVWGFTAGVPAMRTGTGRGNALYIDIFGSVLGSSGPANSGVGGDALQLQEPNVHLQIHPGGAMWSGGGGGGIAGQGGPGFYQTPYTAYEGPYLQSGYGVFGSNQTDGFPGTGGAAYWAGVYLGNMGGTATFGAYTYYMGARTNVTWGGSSDNGYHTEWQHSLQRSWTAYAPNYTAGGAPGAGARGAGLNEAGTNLRGSGAAGAGGGLNAGNGGTGGGGGDWGASGTAGGAGAPGNNGGGAAGTAGGLAGRYIVGTGFLAFEGNNGSVLGRRAA